MQIFGATVEAIFVEWLVAAAETSSVVGDYAITGVL
jgi:hypothetical protein